MKRDVNKKDKSQKKKVTNKKSEFIIDLRGKIKTDDDDRAQWKDKMITASNQRLGVKRITNKPYPGAPNIPLPETDKLIKKQIPNLVLSAWSSKRMVSVKVEEGVQETPDLKEKAKKCEMAMNMILKTKMDFFDKLMLAADNAKQYGHCIARISEKFKSRKVHKVINLKDFQDEQIQQLKALSDDEMKLFLYERYNLDPEDKEDQRICRDIIDQVRSDEDVVEFDIEEISSFPDIDIPLPTKIVVPAYATDINISPRITYEYFLTKDEMQANIDREIFLDKDLENLDLTGVTKGESDIVEKQKGQNEGITDNTSHTDLYRIHEVCCWYKPTENSVSEKWVFTFLADVLDPEGALLQEMPFPFEFEGWNYDKYDNEIKDPRYYSSRGIPEQIRAIQEMMERGMNNMLIRDEMNNTPMWEVLSTSELMDSHIRFVPGMKMPVTALGQEIKRLNDPITVDVSSERLMQLLKAYAEEYQGNVDQLFRNATNKGGGKTLGEIKEGVNQSSGPINAEVINFNNFLSKIYKKIFDIMKERLGDSIWINGTEVTREDFNFPAEVRSNGQLEVADKELSTQKAMMRVQMQEKFIQAGIANQEDMYNAAQDWLEKDGVKNPDDFITNPEEILKTKLAQMSQQLQQMMQQAEELTNANEKAQKQLEGVRQTDVKTRIRKREEMREANELAGQDRAIGEREKKSE